jgi:hypothetical protein
MGLPLHRGLHRVQASSSVSALLYNRGSSPASFRQIRGPLHDRVWLCGFGGQAGEKPLDWLIGTRTEFEAGSWNWASPQHGLDISVPNETHVESDRALRFTDCFSPDIPTDSGTRHGDSGPFTHRSLCRARLGNAAPGARCHTRSVGKQTSEARSGLPLDISTRSTRIGIPG